MSTYIHQELGSLERLFERMGIAVLYSGNPEQSGSVVRRTYNPRSWKSYREVAENIVEALKRIGFKRVFLMEESISLLGDLQEKRIHLVWLNSGGVQGRNSVAHAASKLESWGVPYIGHSPVQAALLDSKDLFKSVLRGLNLPTTPFYCWEPPCAKPSASPRFRKIFKRHLGPFVVKPVSGRASQHVAWAADALDVDRKAQKIFENTYNRVLIEPYLAGREFCVGGLGSTIRRDGLIQKFIEPFTFAYMERKLDAGEKIFTSMDLRPITEDRIALLEPNRDGAVIKELRRILVRITQALGLRFLTRMDVREDDAGHLLVLELNPKPDLGYSDGKASSLLALGLQEAGLHYDDLIFSLLFDYLNHALSYHLPEINEIAELLL